VKIFKNIEVKIMFQFVTKQQASEILSMSFSALKKYRLDGTWMEGTPPGKIK
jgi:hypothetical protein